MKVSQEKQKKIAAYDPSAIGLANGNLFGLPFSLEESEVVVIPVPWEVTVSYRGGAAEGPAAILEASTQVDLYDPDIKDAWKTGITMAPVSSQVSRKNIELRKKAEKCIAHLEKGGSIRDAKVKSDYRAVNDGCAELNKWLEKESGKYLDEGKIVGVLGGDHSVPLGYMRALAKKYPKYSILHLDAHTDIRKAYEGFEYSHASIQYNASKIASVDRIVMAGIRDYSEQEAERIKESKGRIAFFGDREIKRKLFEGRSWQKICRDMVNKLSKNVYVSFDIDVLNPSLCPNTGTPVPGGFDADQVFYLLETILKSGRKIIGFDLCEVAGGGKGDWDAIVGARVLFRIANLAAKSQRRS